MVNDNIEKELEDHQKLCKAKSTGPCRGCSAKVLWARNRESGKLIPLDAKAIVYRIVSYPEDPNRSDTPIEVVRVKDAFVTHFATCPHAKTFSGSRKRDGK